MITRRIKQLILQHKAMAEAWKRNRIIASQTGISIVDDDGDVLSESDIVTSSGTAAGFSGQGALATKDTVGTTDIDEGAISGKESVSGHVAASGSYQLVTAITVLSGVEISTGDLALVTATVNAPGTVASDYQLTRYEEFDEEIVSEFTVPVGCRLAIPTHIDFSDGLQPMIVNELISGAASYDLYGGSGSDTQRMIGQIFQTTAGMDGESLRAVEFYVTSTGTTGSDYTAYLYDSDGSAIGSSVLDTSDNCSNEDTVGQWLRFTFPSTYYTLSGSTYYALVVTRATRSTSNYLSFVEGASYGSGAAKAYTSGAWGNITGLTDFAFKIFTTIGTGDWGFGVYGRGDTGNLTAKIDVLRLRR